MRVKIKRFIKNNKEFSLILLIALIARLIFLFSYNQAWWDSGVYAGMGKFIFSLGKAGLWEHIRPVLLPFFLGLLWKLNLDIVFFGKLLELFFTAGSITLLYLIAKHVFDKKTALITTVIFSFSSVLFFMGFHMYTEIPAVFLVLAGLYEYLKEKHFLAGLFLGLAFIAKFPAALFPIALLAVIIFSKDAKKIALFCSGFTAVAVPFFIINQIAYGNFLLPFIDARMAITAVLGCNYLWFKPWHWYLSFLFSSENFLHLFSIAGIYYFIKKPNLKKTAVFSCMLLPFIYFIQLHCRDYRYLIFVVPFIAVFTAYGIKRQIKQKKHFMPVLFAVLLVSAAVGIGFYYENKAAFDEIQQKYFEFIKNKAINGEVWSSNPVIAIYSDAKVNKIYYPVYDAQQSWLFYQYLKKSSEKVEYVFLDSCGGGIICNPEDIECAKNLGYTYNYLNKNFNLVYNKSRGKCTYRIYKNKLF